MEGKSMIMVACHKPCDIYDKGIYTPIQVGKAISKYDLGFLGDDTGDNISAKNPSYCELTAQYWAWKNLKCKYIGLCHYRRYFETVYTEHSLDAVFSRYDVILPKPIYYGIRETMLHKLRMNILPEDCAIFLLSIRKLYPEYEKSMLLYLSRNMDIPFNMFVMRKEDFDKFCQWQFSILRECEKHVKPSPYSRYNRIYGYFAEYLLPIYCLHNHWKIRYEPVVGMIGEHANRQNPLRVLLSKWTSKKPLTSFDGIIGESVLLGLRNDGIIL